MKTAALILALLLSPRLCAAQDEEPPKAAGSLAAREAPAVSAPSMSGEGKKQQIEKPSRADEPEEYSDDEDEPQLSEEQKKKKEKEKLALGAETYPLPRPVKLTLYVTPGADKDGVSLLIGSLGFQMRSIFHSADTPGIKISLEIFGEFSYFDDEPRLKCKGSYAVERYGKSETFEFDLPYTFFNRKNPIIVLHSKDGKSLSVTATPQ
ncbi:MAG: hypothetical protein GX410_01485 [Elusimicrobia bacterium]|nr:hypothetical protein [Elusimicrobiota bacterium]